MGDIREIRQKDFQAVDVVGFRTGFRKEASSKSPEGKPGIKSARTAFAQGAAPPCILHHALSASRLFAVRVDFAWRTPSTHIAVQ